MARIFISYKRVDKDKVFKIKDQIESALGEKCWIDLEGIESGDHFDAIIINAIDNADIVIFMLSKDFIAPYKDEKTGEIDLNRETFPQKEVKYAIGEGKRVVPVIIDGTSVNDCKWLKFNCGGKDCIDWRIQEQKNKLIRNMAKWLDPDGDYSEDEAIPHILPSETFYHKACNWLKQYWKIFSLVSTVIVLALGGTYIYTSPNQMHITVSGIPKDSLPSLYEQMRVSADILNDSAIVKVKALLSSDERFDSLDYEDKILHIDSILSANPLNAFSYATTTDNNIVVKWIRKVIGKNDIDVELSKNGEVFTLRIPSTKNIATTNDMSRIAGYIAREYSPLSSLLFDYTPAKSEYSNSNNWKDNLYSEDKRLKLLEEIKQNEQEKYYYDYVVSSIKHNVRNNNMQVSETLPLKVLKLAPEIKTNCEQLIIVEDQKTIKSVPKAKLYCFEKHEDKWVKVDSTYEVNLGFKGISDLNKKSEGDKRVPAGCYQIYRAFGYNHDIKTGLDYQVVSDKHIWICDPDDARYNTMIDDTDGAYIGVSPDNTYERLRRVKRGKLDNIYKYVIIIEYNVNPVVKGKGSAIFIHIERSTYSPTDGCIAIPENKIIKLLQWLDKTKHPYIYITKEQIN